MIDGYYPFICIFTASYSSILKKQATGSSEMLVPI
jgi:hypothetical protein